MPEKNLKLFEILLIEDNPGDARLVREVLKEGESPTRLHHVEDGLEAMAFLRREGRYANNNRPSLILLDLNLPGMDGRQVLAAIKNDPAFRSIPVVVLTTSAAERDVAYCYDLHVNSYISKPLDFSRFVEVIRGIGHYWFTLSTPP